METSISRTPPTVVSLRAASPSAGHSPFVIVSVKLEKGLAPEALGTQR